MNKPSAPYHCPLCLSALTREEVFLSKYFARGGHDRPDGGCCLPKPVWPGGIESLLRSLPLDDGGDLYVDRLTEE